jgi:hypothetical protein
LLGFSNRCLCSALPNWPCITPLLNIIFLGFTPHAYDLLTSRPTPLWLYGFSAFAWFLLTIMLLYLVVWLCLQASLWDSVKMELLHFENFAWEKDTHNGTTSFWELYLREGQHAFFNLIKGYGCSFVLLTSHIISFLAWGTIKLDVNFLSCPKAIGHWPNLWGWEQQGPGCERAALERTHCYGASVIGLQYFWRLWHKDSIG